MGLPGVALAGGVLPSGGQFVAGDGAIATRAGALDVRQTSPRAVIDWRSFSIGAANTVAIHNGAGATLNRVTGAEVSRIDGVLRATGSAWLINPSGVVIGPGGQVLTGGSFLASTRDVTNGAFMQGGPLVAAGSGDGAVVNRGRIAAGGDVMLIGASASNSGRISAPAGAVALAAGNRVLVDPGAPDGDILIATGGDGNAGNTGRIAAAQAEIAAAHGNAYALAGNAAGVIAATGTAVRHGVVWLTAGGAVTIGGQVTAREASGAGGTIVATGQAVAVASNAVLDASGRTAGGRILLGGDRGGGRVAAQDLLTRPLPTAQTTRVAAGAQLDVAGGSGAGGSVVVWSDRQTDFAGTIQGGSVAPGQSGGFAEVSSAGVLHYTGRAALRGAGGQAGSLLLDPENLTIVAAGTSSAAASSGGFTAGVDNSTLTTADLTAALAGASVTVSTGTGGSQSGDIAVDASFGWNGATSLTLSAAHSISVATGVTISNTGSGSLALDADTAGTGTGTLVLNGRLAFDGGSVSLADGASGVGSVPADRVAAPGYLIADGTIAGSGVVAVSGAGTITTRGGTGAPVVLTASTLGLGTSNVALTLLNNVGQLAAPQSIETRQQPATLPVRSVQVPGNGTSAPVLAGTAATTQALAAGAPLGRNVIGDWRLAPAESAAPAELPASALAADLATVAPGAAPSSLPGGFQAAIGATVGKTGLVGLLPPLVSGPGQTAASQNAAAFVSFRQPSGAAGPAFLIGFIGVGTPPPAPSAPSAPR